MANNSILKLQVDDKQYEASLKSAQQGLKALQDALRGSGKSFADVDNQTEQYVRELGKMGAAATSSRGKISEMSSAFVELSRVEKQMTDQERQSPVGKALTQSLEQLKRRTIEAKQELDDLNKELQVGGTGGSDKLSGMLQVFGGNLMTKAAGMAASFASEMGEMVKQGIELAKQGEGIRIAFERLGRGDILDGLREATHGTVTDLELMKAAVKFNDFRLPIEELGTMLAFAQQKAKDTGQSVDYMVDSIVTGLGRKSLMILDNLGLSAAEIKEKMAETGDMTKAVGQIIREQMEKAGDYVETAADRAAQANVSLQNKMEELGRKFGPVQEASNQLWTSMKIGILDVVGGPLAKLLNGLTEAGRLRNMLNQMNGNSSTGQSSPVDKQLAKLRVAQKAGSSYMTKSLYNDQMQAYWRQINTAENLKKEYQNAGMFGGKGLILGRISRQFNVNVNGIEDIDNLISSLHIMKDEYNKSAKAIMNPIKPTVDTNGATQNIDTLKVKLKELEAQRKKAIQAGDNEQSKKLLQQINQVKADIRGLDQNALKTGSGGHKVTKQEQAENKIEEAERTYAETLQKSAIRMEVGLDSTLEGKKKELAAQERLFDAYNDAYATYADPRYKKAAQDAADKIKTLAGEVKSMTDSQEAVKKAAHELELAQKKLADAETSLTEAQKSGSPTAVYKAQQALEKLKGNGPQDTGTLYGNMKQTIQAELKFDQMKVDEATLHTLLTTAIQNGLDKITPDYAGLQKRIAQGIDIPNSTWESLQNEINENLKKLGVEPIKINFETGGIENVKKGADATSKSMNQAASAISSVGSALQQIEDPTAKVVGIVAQAIATIALSFADALGEDRSTKSNIWAFIGASAASMGAMISAISQIHSATGYAEGGIVKGNTYSGDMIQANDGSIGLNAGEVVLNHAQQGVLASQLQGVGGSMNLRGIIRGEDILVVADRSARRQGKGELLFWK